MADSHTVAELVVGSGVVFTIPDDSDVLLEVSGGDTEEVDCDASSLYGDTFQMIELPMWYHI